MSILIHCTQNGAAGGLFGQPLSLRIMSILIHCTQNGAASGLFGQPLSLRIMSILIHCTQNGAVDVVIESMTWELERVRYQCFDYQ